MKINDAKKILNEHGYLVESKVATKEDFDNLFKVHGFRKEDNDSEVKYIQAATLDEWKSKVIGSLPKGASIKMRMDIEEFLDGIKNVY